MSDGYKNGFHFLIFEIKRRFLKPTGQVTFWASLVVGTVGVGAMGFWLEGWKYFVSVHRDLNGLNTALQTYFPALAWAAVAQLLFVDETPQRPIQALSVVVLVILLFISLVCLSGASEIPLGFALFLGAIASIGAIGMWWITIGGSFNDQINPETPLGGSPNKELPGDTTEYSL